MGEGHGVVSNPHVTSPRTVPESASVELSAEQEGRVQNQIDGHSPEDHGIASPLWTRRAVRELIQRGCGLEMPIRTVGEYLKRWGYTAKTPRRHARRQDPEEVRKWLENEYPKLERRAAKEHAEIHWCDETGIAADQHLGYGYAREGERATVEVPDRHVRVNMVSTINTSGKLHFMTYKSTLTAAVFVVFLERLLRHTTGKLFLVVDRLKAHEGAAVSAWLERHRDRIELFALPRYSPELNPVEYLNNEVKGSVNREHLPDSGAELRSRLRSVMRTLQGLPEKIIHLFNQPQVQYAAAGM